MRRQRSFRPRLPDHGPTYADREAVLRQIALKYQGCTEWPADEALLVSSLVRGLESVEPERVVYALRLCKLSVPVRLLYDRYRLIKYYLSFWHDPVIRERILTKATLFHGVENVKRRLADPTPEVVRQLVHQYGPENLFAIMQVSGLQEKSEMLLSMLDEEDLAYYRGDVLIGQIVCHKLWREKEPETASLRKRRSLIQRIQRRSVTLRYLQHSLYSLNQDRKALVRLAWEAERGASQALDQLIRQQEDLHAKLEAMNQAHAKRVSALQSGHAEVLGALRSNLEERRRTLAEALAERARWSQALPLVGQTVVVVGDTGHAEAYEAAVEALGGRPVVVDGLERFGRIREVAPEADAVILVTAAIKHSAEALLTASVPSEVPVLYCSRAGQASLERTLRAELLPRLIARRAAASEQGGGPDAG